ncbi:MAG: AmmeMemoRadiSam system protein B [Nanoarchaeota archaeon]
MVRQPIVAGQFYAGSRDALLKQVKACFADKRGPGLPSGRTNETVAGAIVPHAGFMYSGPCAAFAYKTIAEGKKPDLFVIYGVNHHGLGGTALLLDDFETPLGTVKVDRAFGEALLDSCRWLSDSAPVHAFEHSIEVQLPFLQFVMPSFEFLPIIVSSASHLDEIATAVRKVAVEQKKTVCVIASSDFTHFGENYGFMPFAPKRELIEKLDKGAIDNILRLDSAGFARYVEETGATICGRLPIQLLLKTLQAGKARLISYYLSGDIAGGYENSVSYAAIVFS